MAFIPIHAVGLQEEALKEKVQDLGKRGWIEGSKSPWVVRGFLVPKPWVNKWRLVIDYRYLNSCLEGHEFPLPVIEDLLQPQHGNHLWTILDLEDGFHKMPLTEESRPLTAFCTPWGVYKWKVLPMGMRVGPQVYQRMVIHCIRHLLPSVRPCIDDLLVGTPSSKASGGKNKLLYSCSPDEEARTEHYELVRKPFRCLADHHLQVKEEKYHLFCQRAKHCGHIPHQGQRSPAPEKVAAVRDWTEAMIRTSEQMKEFLRVSNLYSLCIPQYASLAAPLMDSLREKYERAAEAGKCKVPKDCNFIEWTEIMRQSFAKVKEALWKKCALYIPNDTSEYAIRTDASDFGICGVLEQPTPDGSWASYYSCLLRALRSVAR